MKVLLYHSNLLEIKQQSVNISKKDMTPLIFSIIGNKEIQILQKKDHLNGHLLVILINMDLLLNKIQLSNHMVGNMVQYYLIKISTVMMASIKPMFISKL